MITTGENREEDIDTIWHPFKTEGLDEISVRELTAELPCACRAQEHPCVSCFARLMLMTLD